MQGELYILSTIILLFSIINRPTGNCRWSTSLACDCGNFCPPSPCSSQPRHEPSDKESYSSTFSPVLLSQTHRRVVEMGGVSTAQPVCFIH